MIILNEEKKTKEECFVLPSWNYGYCIKPILEFWDRGLKKGTMLWLGYN